MLFGLYNATATFQRFIQQVCQSLRNAMSYVDDIIVFSNTEEEHRLHVFETFQRLDKFNVGINVSKYEFDVKSLSFL